MNQFLRFALVGTLGFATDFAVLYAAVNWLHLGPASGRLLSFLVAATVTWQANRHYTFAVAGAGTLREWLRYLVLTGVGGGINLAVYLAWLGFAGRSTLDLLTAVAAGSGTAMVFNFWVSRRVVFAG